MIRPNIRLSDIPSAVECMQRTWKFRMYRQIWVQCSRLSQWGSSRMLKLAMEANRQDLVRAFPEKTTAIAQTI